MNRPQDQDEADEMKKKIASEGPKLKKELDKPGKLMVSGIPKDAKYRDEQLKSEFSVFGKVLEVVIIRKKSTGIPKGFAFVTFQNPADAENATNQLEGKDIGGDNPLHCARAVIGFIKQSQIASSRARMHRGRGGPWMERGRGTERGRGMMMERGRGFRGMRGGPPHMQRGRGGRGYGGDMDTMYYPGEEFYGGDNYSEDFASGYPDRGRGASRGHPPQRGMMQADRLGRGASPGMRGRGGAGGPEHGGGGRRTLLPSPPEMRGARGGGRGRGHPGHPPPPTSPREEYYPEEESYGGEYAGGEEYYEEDQYGSSAGYAEEDSYRDPDGGYYGVPEDPSRSAPAPRERSAQPPPASRRGRGAPPGPPSYRGGSGNGRMPSRGAAAGGGQASGPARRQVNVDPYGYPEERPRGPPRQRQTQTHGSDGYGEDFYGEGVMESVPVKDPYARPRGRGQPLAPGRTGAPRQAPGRYADDPYAAYGTGDAAQSGMYEEEAYDKSYGDSYGGSAAATSGRRGAPSLARSPGAVRGQQPPAAESGGYVDISEYIGQGQGRGPGARHPEERQRQPPHRDLHGEARRPVHPRRDDPYMDERIASETDAYVSYPPSSRMGEHKEAMGRKRPMDGYGAGVADSYGDYEEYRGIATPNKRERVERPVYETYSSRQEGVYRRL